MKLNQSSADRATRIWAGIAALFIAVVGLGVFQGEVVGIVIAALGAVSLLTGLIGFCPAYAICRAGTCPTGTS